MFCGWRTYETLYHWRSFLSIHKYNSFYSTGIASGCLSSKYAKQGSAGNRRSPVFRENAQRNIHIPHKFEYLSKMSRFCTLTIDSDKVRCYYTEKLNRLDRGAISKSTPCDARQRHGGKGAVAEGTEKCLFPRFLGCRRTSGGLSQNFVERYRRSSQRDIPVPIIHEPPAKRFIF